MKKRQPAPDPEIIRLENHLEPDWRFRVNLTEALQQLQRYHTDSLGSWKTPDGVWVLFKDLEAVLETIAPPQTWQPLEARTDLDMLQVDRLRAWARNIREYGANIGQWGSPAFVADECERIAADVERSIKRWTPTCAPGCVDCADESMASPRGGSKR